jgi:hypothetical protein
MDENRPATRAWQYGDDTEPRIPASWVDDNDNVYPKVHKVKGRWQETAVNLVLFPLLKVAAVVLALFIIGALVAGTT